MARLNSFRSFVTAPLRAFSEVKLLAVLLLANLGVALIQSFPLLFPALGHFGQSTSGVGQPFPSTEAMVDFGKLMAQGGGPFFAGSMVLGLLGSFGLQLVLSGGIVSRLCSNERFTLGEFARNCARLIGRNARLLGWALLGLIPVVGVGVGSAALLKWKERPTLFTMKAESLALDNPFDVWTVGHLALVLCVFALWRASFDLARVQLFADDQRKTRVAAWRALKKMVRSPGALLGYIGVGALGLCAVLVLARLHAAVPVTSAGRAWLTLLLGQLVIAGRLGFSVATTAFTVDVYRALPPLAVPKPKEKKKAAAEQPPAGEQKPTDAPAPAGEPQPVAPAATGSASPEQPSAESPTRAA
ncbi:MAG TPA: hypothetical protein VK447_19170 [Myxococcaceae bacterium]|nr:hypothetical protein [Myxococcaceae bacterium]